MTRQLHMLGIILALCFSFTTFGQSYNITNSALNVGNPGGLRTASDATTTGGTSILNGGTGSTTVNYWSAPVSIPFPFQFYGSPVTDFIVTKNGLLSFDVSRANTAVGAALNVNTALPNANLPDQTLAFFWEDTSSTSISSSDHVYTYTYGTAPNRQMWVHYYSFEVGSQSYAYWAAVLEETSNNIYVVDMNYNSSGSNYSGTVGIQVDATTAYEVTNPLNGTAASPNLEMGTDGSSESNNEYWTFSYVYPPGACLPPSALGVSNTTSSSADANWTSGGAAHAIVEYGPAGFSLGTGTQVGVTGTSTSITGLTPNTSYDYYVRDSCGVGDVSSWIGPLSFTTLCAGQLSGTYTIDGSSPTGGTNFNSFAEAGSELSACGISGPVTFNVASGTYTGHLHIIGVVGASATNTITFNGSGADTLIWDGNAPQATVLIDGTSYVTLSNMIIGNTVSSEGWGVLVTNNSDNVTIDNNIIVMDSTSTSGDLSPILVSSSYENDLSEGADVDNLTITNNVTIGGYYAMNFEGVTTGNPSLGYTVSNNVIRNFYLSGIYIDELQDLVITNNVIKSDRGTPDGIYAFDINNYTVEGNTISVGDYGLYISDGNDGFTTTTNSTIINNMIISTTDYGIYLNDFENTDVFHNSVWGEPAIRINDQINLDARNNIFVSTSDYAFESTDALDPSDMVDYNLYYSTGSNAFDIGTSTYADLAAWQAAESSYNVNSLEGDPLFVGMDDLHVIGTLANDAGDATVGVSLDIDGETRSLTAPDVGADEYVPASCVPSSDLTVTLIGADSAVVSWLAGSGTSFNIEYGLAGFASGSGTTVTAITDTFYVITGLTAATGYEFYVQDDCGGSTSIWSIVGSFTTGFNPATPLNCTTGNPTTVFTEDFDAVGGWTGDINGGDDTWEIPDAATSSNTGADAAHSGSNYMNFEASNTSVSSGEIVSPAIDLSTGIGEAQLSFWMHAYGADMGTLTVSVGSSATGPWTPVFTWSGQYQTSGSDPWANIGVDLTPYLGQVIYLQFHQLDDGSSFEGDMSIDLVEVMTCSSCPAPTSLDLISALATSANIYWTSGGASDWNIEYGTSGFTLGSGTMVSASNDTATITGLSPETSYDVYVRDSCAVGDASGWFGPLSFTTPCVAVVAPWTEDFENGGSIPNCWSQGASNNKDWEFANSPGFDHIGNNGTMGGSTSSGGYFAWVDDSGPHELGTTLQSPMIDVSALSVPALSFFYISHNEGNTNVDFSVEVWDGAGWNIVHASNSNSANGEWEEVIVDLSTLTITGDIQVRFIIDENNGTDFYDDLAIDDVSVMEMPSCSAPSALGATNIATSSADIFWTGGGAADWNVEYGTAGFTQGSGTTLDATNDTVNVTGLSSATAYEFYVRDSCGVGNVSSWAGPFSFSTLVCDTSGSAACTYAFSLIDDYGDGWNGGELVLYQGGIVVSILDFPAVLGGQDDTLRIVNVPLCDGLPTYVVVEDEGSWPSEMGFDINDPFGAMIQSFATGTGLQTGDTVGTFTVSCTAPVCPAPANLGAFNATPTSAEIFWTGGGAANWNIEYGQTGFTPGTGTMMSVTNDTVSLTALTSATCYDFYVQDSCSVGNVSAWVGPFTFCTPCPVQNIPYTETWESTSTTISCWAVEPNWALAAVGGYGNSSVSVTFPFYNVSTGAFAAYSPEFTPVPANYQLSFDHAYATYTGGEVDSVEIYYSTDGGATFNLLVGLDGGANGALTTAPPTSSAFVPTASQWSNFTISLPAGTNMIVFNAITAYGNNAYFDNINVEPQPSCTPSSQLGMASATQNTAEVYWTPGGTASNWNIEYGPTGFSPGTGTMMNVTNDTVTLTGLMASMCYDFYVQDSCGVGAVSPWVGPFTVCTQCVPFIAPYHQTFDVNTVPLCWTAYAGLGDGWQFGQLGSAGYAAGSAAEQTGNGGYYAWVDFSGTDSSTVLEMYDVDVSALTVPALQFSLFSENVDNNDYNDLIIEAWDGSAWNQVDSLHGDLGGWEIFNLDLSSHIYNTDLVRVRFRAESGGGVDDYSNDLLIDNVSIIEFPPCNDPVNFIASGSSTTTVDLSWGSDTNVTSSIVEYGAVGFTPGTGTLASTAIPGSITISGLTASSCYDFYVLDSCSGATNWIGPLTACTKAPCTVSGIPTNLIGDSTGCGGGGVTLTGSATAGQRLAWMLNGQAVGLGDTLIDTITHTSIYEAANLSTSGSQIHLGPLPSIATAGFGNYTNGQYITVYDTLVIDSTTVRANGYVRAQVIITDGLSVTDGGNIIQRGKVFTTDPGVTANYQVEAGIVLTPGSYFIGIDFLPGTTGSLFRATGGAVFPYVEPGLMSIDNVNYAGPRYYYTFDLVIQNACIGMTTGVLAHVPGANAGISDSVTVCANNATVDLTDYLGVYDFGGTWYDDDNSGALTDSLFNATSVTAGSYYQFTYGLPSVSGCPGDSAVVTVFVENPPFAGIDTNTSICKTASILQLNNLIPGADGGGVWVDLSGTGALNNSLLLLSNLAAGVYDFAYVIEGVGCVSDSALVSVNVDAVVNAGADASDALCTGAGMVDLSTYLDANASAGGNWVDVSGSGALTGSMFDPGAVSAGQYIFRYMLLSACGADSATIDLTVEMAPMAGMDASDTICDTIAPVDLTTYLDANATAGGTWIDVDATGALTGSMFDPGAVNNVSSYSFGYAVNNDCGADTAMVTVYVDDCNIGLREFGTATVSVYPNPTTGIFYVERTQEDGRLNIEIYSASGQLVMKHESGESRISLDLHGFADGIYNMKITTGNGVEIHRITKQ